MFVLTSQLMTYIIVNEVQCITSKSKMVKMHKATTSTLSVKRNITSSERHSLKSKALKLIIIGDRLGIVLLTKHISKNKRLIE